MLDNDNQSQKSGTVCKGSSAKKREGGGPFSLLGTKLRSVARRTQAGFIRKKESEWIQILSRLIYGVINDSTYADLHGS